MGILEVDGTMGCGNVGGGRMGYGNDGGGTGT